MSVLETRVIRASSAWDSTSHRWRRKATNLPASNLSCKASFIGSSHRCGVFVDSFASDRAPSSSGEAPKRPMTVTSRLPPPERRQHVQLLLELPRGPLADAEHG